MKTCSPTNFTGLYNTLYFPQLLEGNLSETVISQTQTAFICSAIITVRIKCKLCSKLTVEAPDVILVLLFLTFNILDHCSSVFFAGFEHVNAGWSTLLS